MFLFIFLFFYIFAFVIPLATAFYACFMLMMCVGQWYEKTNMPHDS